jgi:hypothetical protein
LFRHAVEILEPALARFPHNPRLSQVRSELDRERVLHDGDGTLALLHRKALRLCLDEKYVPAMELLTVVFTLAPSRDPEVCALLSEATVSRARELLDSEPAEATKLLRRAEKLLAVGRKIAPAHKGMENTREQLARARERAS